MKKIATLLLLAIIGIAAASASDIERYTINVGEFNRLKIVDGLNVEYTQNADSAGVAVLYTTREMASVIGFSNKKSELVIELNTLNVPTEGRPTIRVSSSFLTNVENQGDSLVRVLSVADCPMFSAVQVGNGRVVVRQVHATTVKANLKTGNGTIVVNGTCNEASLKLTGSGTIQADGLKAQTVSVSGYGTGSVGCDPLSLLKVYGVGSTKVYYRGNPEIRKRSVGLKIEPLK